MSAPVNAFYAARVPDFLSESPEKIVGALTTRNSLLFRVGAPEQVRAWQDQVEVLRKALAAIPDADEWSLLLEYSLHRLGKRPDALVLLPGLIAVIEFKMGAVSHSADHVRQVEDYALCIRDFHPAARGNPGRIPPHARFEASAATLAPKTLTIRSNSPCDSVGFS